MLPRPHQPGEVAAEVAVEPAPPVPEQPAPAATDAAETAAAPAGADIESVAARRYGAVGRALRRPLGLRHGRWRRIFALPILPALIAA
jgi:hypothetical protein